MSIETAPTTSPPSTIEEEPTKCPYSLAFQNFAGRHTTDKLHVIAVNSPFAGYANSDAVKHPDADSI